MSTEKDEYGVYHIDGPPVAGFVLAEFPDGTGQRVEIRYKIFSYYGTKASCERIEKNLMNLVISELQDLIEIQPVSFPTQPIIWWRRRPEIRQDEEDKGRWQFYARFDTTPKLPDAFWERFECHEGEPVRSAREFVDE